MLVEKDVLGPALPLVPFPKKLMKIPFKTWSCWFAVDSPYVVSSYSSFIGLYGVSPNSPNTCSISIATITTFSMSV
jgi:hypothetical protein